MKTPILRFTLILCLVFLGFKSAKAASVSVTIAQVGSPGNNGLAANPINTQQSGIAIYGFSIAGTGANGSTAVTINSLTFNPTSTKNNNYFFPTVSLYNSAT